MRILGIDFTSSPNHRKRITCVPCELNGNRLVAGPVIEWANFQDFERALQEPGPWIAGIDFPFGQAEHFIENIGWPKDWAGYVAHARGLGRDGFRAALDTYRSTRAVGDKEHRRKTDVLARSISPQKLYGVPVGLMFFEGAGRLLSSGVTIPGIMAGDPERIVVEAYPGVIARTLIGRRRYKNDTRAKQTVDQLLARKHIFRELSGSLIPKMYGFTVDAPASVCEDPGADHLDALLCAVQAAWAWRQRASRFGAPELLNAREGWIADPSLV